MSHRMPERIAKLERGDATAKQIMRQLEIAFPGLMSLVEQKSMDNEIWPSKKPPHTDEASLTVAKGMHVVDAKRRKA